MSLVLQNKFRQHSYLMQTARKTELANIFGIPCYSRKLSRIENKLWM